MGIPEFKWRMTSENTIEESKKSLAVTRVKWGSALAYIDGALFGDGYRHVTDARQALEREWLKRNAQNETD